MGLISQVPRMTRVEILHYVQEDNRLRPLAHCLAEWPVDVTVFILAPIPRRDNHSKS